MALLAIGLLSIISPVNLAYAARPPPSPSVYSWNLHVTCNPVVVTIEQILGTQTDSLGGALESGSSFAPGSGTLRSLSPPCTVTNSQGSIVSVFVQLNGVQLVDPVNDENCANSYDSVNGGDLFPNASIYCDTTGNLHTAGQSSNCSSTDTSGCMHRIFLGIDRDWKAAGYCGTGTMCDNSTLRQVTPTMQIDVQGFLYWSNEALDQPWHSFSGWEIHPLTAWKLSSSSPPAAPPASLTVGLTWSPTAPQVGQQVLFKTGVFGGTAPYTFSWSFGDGTTLSSTVLNSTHVYFAPGSYNITLNVVDSFKVKGRASLPLVVPIGTSQSWNPNVSCTPLVITIEQLLGQPNSNNEATLSASAFNSGVPNKRTLAQPCTITNSDGQVIGAFVEIRGVKRDYVYESDWSTSFDSSNGGANYAPCPSSPCVMGDTTFHVYNPAYSNGSDCVSGSPTCLHILQVEIDHDWKGAGYCGTGTQCDNNTLVSPGTIPFSTALDVQGFAYWDPDHVDEASHSFSGWELHPLTAWRIHQDLPSPSISYTPSSPYPGGTVSLTGTTTNGTAPYAYSWSFGDGTAGAGASVTHVFAMAGNYVVQLLVSDAAGVTVAVASKIVVSPDFSLTSSQTSVTVPRGSSSITSITLTSLGGFTGSVSLSAVSNPKGPTLNLGSSKINLAVGATATTTLKISASSRILPGTYAIVVTAKSGTLTHSTTIIVNVT